jgi:hypothetical protein
MTPENHHIPLPQRNLPRQIYLQIVQAGLEVQQFRFACEAALLWLTSYPGDLEASLAYAQALLGEKRPRQALPVLQGLCMADPEFEEAVKALLQLADPAPSSPVDGLSAANDGLPMPSDGSPTQADGFHIESNGANKRLPGLPGKSKPASTLGIDIRANLFALTGQCPDKNSLPGWGNDLWLARQALKQGDLFQAEEKIRHVLSVETPSPLACVTHLELLAANQATPMQTRLETAGRYHQSWPACLACTLYLADWSMGNSDSGQAVALLHQAAAQDVSGQVAKRLWGEIHPYLRLWPEQLELPLSLPIPAEVMALMGWNRLVGGLGEAAARLVVNEAGQVQPPEVNGSQSPILVGKNAEAKGQLAEINEQSIDRKAQPAEQRKQDVKAVEIVVPTGDQSSQQPAQKAESAENRKDALQPVVDNASQGNAQDETLRSVHRELARLAKRLKLPDITHRDGRFPVYVVFSVRSRLEAVYGIPAAATLETEMKRLVRAMQGQRRWNALLFYADDPSCTACLGIKPARPTDPWELKLALTDLDAALARRGEMIGAVIIVGGPEIVPFHRLPNPVDDPDDEVPSDAPYATRDENYFVPEWPVGRLPGGVGSDPKLLLEALQHISDRHTQQISRLAWHERWVQHMVNWLQSGRNGRQRSFGYTAAIWRHVAAGVFRPIGESHRMHVSPPLGIIEPVGCSSMEGVEALSVEKGKLPPLVGRLGYFNLHGLADAPEWYGQRDPLDECEDDQPDYPVALRPQDIEAAGGPKTGLPQVVFSEACYGMYIQDRASDEAMALKFLEAGCQAVVGSTCMCYGSIGMPLIAADLLGHAFWNFLKEGLPAGEALRQAKIFLVNEMQRRQGYLDGEDQKTLISFILFGDPLAQPIQNVHLRKSVHRMVTPPGHVPIVCDLTCASYDGQQAVPAEVVASVKEVVAQYLPGMAGANLAYVQEHACCNGEGTNCLIRQLRGSEGCSAGEQAEGKSTTHRPSNRRLVTLSKRITSTDGVHAQYARLTLDERGKLLKLVVSR